MGHINNMEHKAAVILGKKDKLNFLATVVTAKQAVDPSVVSAPVPASWSPVKGAAGLPFWAFGSVKDTSGSPVPFPKITVQTPSGQPFGAVYTGDSTGAWSMSLPADTYILAITAPGFKTYTNPAYTVANGYKLYMEKLPAVAPIDEELVYQAPAVMVAQPMGIPQIEAIHPLVQTPGAPAEVTSLVLNPATPTVMPSLKNEFSAPAELGGPAATPVAAAAPVALPATIPSTPATNLLFPPAYAPYSAGGSASGGASSSDHTAATTVLVPQAKAHPASYFWIVAACTTLAGYIFFKPGSSLTATPL